MKHLLPATAALLLWLTPLAAAPRDPAQTEPPLSPAQIRDLWRLHWPRYAARYVSLDDDFAPCAKYDRDFPSSRRLTDARIKAETRQTRTVPFAGNMTRRQTVDIPSEDASTFSSAIPALAVGEYGFFRVCTIERILGPLEMIVKDVQVIDPEDLEKQKDKERQEIHRRNTARADLRAMQVQVDFRFQKRDELLALQKQEAFKPKVKLVGFSTAGLEPDMKWRGENDKQRKEGVAIAIVTKQPMPEPTTTRRISRRDPRPSEEVLVAVPAERLKFREMDEDKFRQMLAARGYDEEKFVRLVLAEKAKTADGAEEQVIAILEQAPRVKQSSN